MALTPNFSIAQQLGYPENIDLTDTSTGSDVAITQRRVYIQKSDGSFLVPSGTSTEYVEWPYADTEISIECLEQDEAVLITVQWLNVSNAVLYDKSQNAGLTLYNETFDYGLTQLLAANPLLINDNNFYTNKSNLRTDIDSGDQSIELAGDIFAAQLCYNRATELRLQSQYYFNANS